MIPTFPMADSLGWQLHCHPEFQARQYNCRTNQWNPGLL